MGRFIFWLLLIPVAAVAIVFAVSNRADAPLSLWPLAGTFNVPVFALVLGGMVVGFVLGGFVAWWSGGGVRRRSRQARQRAERAERELEVARRKLGRVEGDLQDAAERAAQAEARASLPAPADDKGGDGDGKPSKDAA